MVSKRIRSAEYFTYVYIKLGYDCNGKCVYCAQKGHEKENLKYNPDIVGYVAKLSAVPRKCASDKLKVVFYGGEPLIYFNIMKKIIRGLYGHEDFVKDNVLLIVMSNGVLLSKEIVDFLNFYSVFFCLGFDAPNEGTRPVRISDEQIALFNDIVNREIIFVWSNVNKSMIESKVYLEKKFGKCNLDPSLCRYIAEDESCEKYAIASRNVSKSAFMELILYYQTHEVDYFLIQLMNDKYFRNKHGAIYDIEGNRHYSCDYNSKCGDIYTDEDFNPSEKSKVYCEKCTHCEFNSLCKGSRTSHMKDGNICECQVLQYINFLYYNYKNVLLGYVYRDGYAVNDYNGYKIIEKVY